MARIACVVDLTESFDGEQDFTRELRTKYWRSERILTRTLEQLGHTVAWFGVHDDLRRLRCDLNLYGPDLIFNLAEAVAGDRRRESDLPRLFASMRIPFTGERAEVLDRCKDKIRTKMIARRAGARIPRSFTFEASIQIVGPTNPLIVKFADEESSLGLTEKSVVCTRHQLSIQYAKLRSLRPKSKILIEEFIEGFDFYVGVFVRNERDSRRVIVLPARELVGTKFATYRTKWSDGYRKRRGIVMRFAKLTPGESEVVRVLCGRIASRLGVKSLARFDFRRTPSGELVFLEANANPDLGTDSDFVLAARRAGIRSCDLLNEIILNAINVKECESRSLRSRQHLGSARARLRFLRGEKRLP